jgi:pimeloyl-ACP methyl ester carboxylesterase
VDDPALDHVIELRGLRFHYRSYPGTGPPLVLLHGLASTSRIWLLVGPLLARRFRVFALDQRGHGESDKPEEGYDFETVAADLDAFLQALGLDWPVLVGHSWGGNVALQYAAMVPDRVQALVLVDGGVIDPARWQGMTWERVEREMAPPDLTHLTPEELVRQARGWFPIWDETVEAALLANFSVAEDGRIRPRLPRDRHLRIVRALWEQRPLELCARIACPVLFVLAERGSDDRSRAWLEHKRATVERAQAVLSSCAVRWLADTIHDIPLHRPHDLARAIEGFVFSLEG